MERECDNCIHADVCRIKFQLKDQLELNSRVNLTVSCDHYMDAVPVQTVQPKEDKKPVKRTTRRAKK